MITVQLTKTEPVATAEQPHIWPLRVVAVSSGGDSAIFVYRVGSDPTDHVFECVASVAQMDELPKAGAAKIEENLQIPYFRQSEVVFNCRSTAERVEIWKKLQYHVQLLVDNLNAATSEFGSPDMVKIQSTPQYPTAAPVNVFTLSSLPVGDVTEADGEQEIVYPPAAPALEAFYEETQRLFGTGVPQVSNDFNYSTSGWLPIEALPHDKITAAVPASAKFWLNLTFYPQLRRRLATAAPYDRHGLTLNGVTLPYGIAYSINADAIYWLDFPPTSVPGFPTAGNAPWATDYADMQNTGTAMLLRLTLQT